MRTMDTEMLTDMLIAVCDKIIQNKPYLTEVDSSIGDGDHGMGMALGMEKAKEALKKERPFEDINQVFGTVGMEMLGSMGGASGVIFGTMFLGGTKGREPADKMDVWMFGQIMRGGLEAVKKRGKAEPGDKTMVDALQPAVIAIQQSEDREFVPVLKRAAKAAEEGAELTKQYVAKFGRAKSLMERAVGHPDAGAVSVSIIFSAMSEFAEKADN